MIDSTSFGTITIDGRSYTSDVILFPDGTVVDGWWRNNGHLLQPVDLQLLVQKKPDLIVIGTGTRGRMRLHNDLSGFLSKRGIAFIAQPTPEAIHTFNVKQSAEQGVAGCFHLTC